MSLASMSPMMLLLSIEIVGALFSLSMGMLLAMYGPTRRAILPKIGLVRNVFWISMGLSVLCWVVRELDVSMSVRIAMIIANFLLALVALYTIPSMWFTKWSTGHEEESI